MKHSSRHIHTSFHVRCTWPRDNTPTKTYKSIQTCIKCHNLSRCNCSRGLVKLHHEMSCISARLLIVTTLNPRHRTGCQRLQMTYSCKQPNRVSLDERSRNMRVVLASLLFRISSIFTKADPIKCIKVDKQLIRIQRWMMCTITYKHSVTIIIIIAISTTPSLATHKVSKLGSRNSRSFT